MSKAQVELEYQKLLWQRNDKILKERKPTRISRFIDGPRLYPMPPMPLDTDFAPDVEE